MLNNYHNDTPINFVLFDSPGYKSLLIFVRNRAQALYDSTSDIFSPHRLNYLQQKKQGHRIKDF